MSLIWGHRGASGYAPENTIESFLMAAQMGADGIELDVQLTKDGQVVVCHDETIDRTSDHTGFIKDYTLAELKQFNFNNHNEKYPNCTIPTLEEVLAAVKPTGMTINIELKTSIFHYPGLEEKTVELVDRYQMADRIIYSSFNHYSVLNILKLVPDAYCAFLHTDVTIGMGAYAQKYGMKALHPVFYFLLDQDYINDAYAHGLEINAWTINDPLYIGAALKMNIHGIITNYPDRAIALREKIQKTQ